MIKISKTAFGVRWGRTWERKCPRQLLWTVFGTYFGDWQEKLQKLSRATDSDIWVLPSSPYRRFPVLIACKNTTGKIHIERVGESIPTRDGCETGRRQISRDEKEEPTKTPTWTEDEILELLGIRTDAGVEVMLTITPHVLPLSCSTQGTPPPVSYFFLWHSISVISQIKASLRSPSLTWTRPLTSHWRLCWGWLTVTPPALTTT